MGGSRVLVGCFQALPAADLERCADRQSQIDLTDSWVDVVDNRHGVYAGHATQLRVSGIQISIGKDGSTDIGEPKTHLLTWMFVYWMEIAVEHLQQAELAHAQLLEKWIPGEPAEGSKHLRDEFSSSMQCINAAAIAVDAFYAAIKNVAPISEDEISRWKAKKTSRPKQIAEVIRRSFGMKQFKVAALQQNLIELFKLRDWGVHPPADLEVPTPYPELSVSTDWWFVEYTASNARIALEYVLKLIIESLSKPKDKYSDLVELCSSCRDLVSPIKASWEELYGPLIIATVDQPRQNISAAHYQDPADGNKDV